MERKRIRRGGEREAHVNCSASPFAVAHTLLDGHRPWPCARGFRCSLWPVTQHGQGSLRNSRA